MVFTFWSYITSENNRVSIIISKNSLTASKGAKKRTMENHEEWPIFLPVVRNDSLFREINTRTERDVRTTHITHVREWMFTCLDSGLVLQKTAVVALAVVVVVVASVCVFVAACFLPRPVYLHILGQSHRHRPPSPLSFTQTQSRARRCGCALYCVAAILRGINNSSSIVAAFFVMRRDLLAPLCLIPTSLVQRPLG